MHSREENILYYQQGGEVYYRTYKPILPGTELLVFYGRSYAEDFLGIDMEKYYITDEEKEEEESDISTWWYQGHEIIHSYYNKFEW